MNVLGAPGPPEPPTQGPVSRPPLGPGRKGLKDTALIGIFLEPAAPPHKQTIGSLLQSPLGSERARARARGGRGRVTLRRGPRPLLSANLIGASLGRLGPPLLGSDVQGKWRPRGWMGQDGYHVAGVSSSSRLEVFLWD